MKVYLENSIFFFHKAHPPSQRKAKSNPSAVSPRTTPQPRMERQPPRRLRPRPWERCSRPAIPATALPAAARTRTLRPAPPRRLRPDPMFATPCLQARGAGNLPAALHPVSPASCAPPSPCDPRPPPARHIPLRFRGHIVFRRTKRYENKTKFCTGPCKMMNFTPSFWSS